MEERTLDRWRGVWTTGDKPRRKIRWNICCFILRHKCLRVIYKITQYFGAHTVGGLRWRHYTVPKNSDDGLHASNLSYKNLQSFFTLQKLSFVFYLYVEPLIPSDPSHAYPSRWHIPHRPRSWAPMIRPPQCLDSRGCLWIGYDATPHPRHSHLRSARPPAIRISTFLRKRVVIVAPYSSIPRTLCFVREQECVTQGHHQHAVPQLLPLPPTVKILWLECNATTTTMRSPCEISARVKKRRWTRRLKLGFWSRSIPQPIPTRYPRRIKKYIILPRRQVMMRQSCDYEGPSCDVIQPNSFSNLYCTFYK